jgi:hypothetical protein
MANELIINYPTGATLYALLFDATGQVWNGSAFAAPASGSWTSYDIAMTEVATATGVYRASMPAAAAGTYTFVVRKQAGGSPDVADIAVGPGIIKWTGTAEETAATAAVAVWASTTRRLTSTASTVTDTVNGTDITVSLTASYAATITGMTIPATWTKLWWTVKYDRAFVDTLAELQLIVSNPAAATTDGVLYVDRAAASAAQRTKGSLTVSQAAGTVAIALDETLTAVLDERSSLKWDIKVLESGGGCTVIAEGDAMFEYTVTRALA